MIPAGASRYVVGALLAVFFLLVVTAASGKSATYDEPVHIYSGWRILTAGDFTTNHEHPPLMKMLAALPLVFSQVAPPRSQIRQEVDQWSVSHEFLYHVNDGDRLLRLARFPIALLATAMAFVLYRVASAWFGWEAGLIALGMLVLEPNILAHSEWVTTDLGITALTLFTFAAFVTHMRAKGRAWLWASGVLFGLALLTKFTAILIAPMLALSGAAIVVLEKKRRWKELVISLIAVAAIGLAVLNLGYGFAGSFSTLRSFSPESAAFRGWAEGGLGAVPLPVPQEYVRGFDHAEAGGQRWSGYLLGEHSMTGWRHYYLVALLVKTPLPLLIAALAGIAAWRRPSGLLPVIPLLVFVAAFTLSGNLKNIGLRYLLPVYPFLCLLAGAAWRLAIPWGKLILGGLLIWQAGIGLWMYPDYLTFFNLTVGGPSRGAEVLLDSNLDWGQDLKGLGEFIRERRLDRIYVDYFGRGCLRYYGVKSTPDFEGGWIAVSATNLKGVYAQDKDRYRFLWDRIPAARIGGSILVYNVEKPAGWVPRGAAGEP